MGGETSPVAGLRVRENNFHEGVGRGAIVGADSGALVGASGVAGRTVGEGLEVETGCDSVVGVLGARVGWGGGGAYRTLIIGKSGWAGVGGVSDWII